MPDNWEYVFSAYGIWGLTFSAYVLYLVRRFRSVAKAQRSLARASEERSRTEA